LQSGVISILLLHENDAYRDLLENHRAGARFEELSIA
jgi:hypothetical protein